MRFAQLLALCLGAALAGCGQPAQPIAQAPETAATPTSLVPAPAPSPPAEPAVATIALPARFIALGTEPFWAARVDGERLTYSTPENQPGESIAAARTATASAVTLRGTLAAGALRLEITEGPCSDGMSDTVYPFTVERYVGNALERGCAKPD